MKEDEEGEEEEEEEDVSLLEMMLTACYCADKGNAPEARSTKLGMTVKTNNKKHDKRLSHDA